jgi:hypothetical protein
MTLIVSSCDLLLALPRSIRPDQPVPAPIRVDHSLKWLRYRAIAAIH